ncbi:MAG: glycerate kinase [Clostridiales bacterium]|nr:glycerate kinase [Clostridiales bacterium]
MRIIVAPDSFKGSLTAAEVCAAICSGVASGLGSAPKNFPEIEIISVPMADGGEGTARSLIDGLGGEMVSFEVSGPLGRPVVAEYGLTHGGTAVIEMAQASGLPLLAEGERDPLAASTFGTGELVLDALDRGAREYIIGIGGSATNDGGTGMATALGYKFLGEDGAELPQGGGALTRLARIDASGADSRLAECRFTVACDVDNPLLGERGASAVFGPQKGATPEMVTVLDRGLARLADCVRTDLGKDVADIPGAGAAGGLGAGSIAFLGAELKRGVDIVIDVTGLAEKLKGASLLITGEGCTDIQTLSGKTVHGVAMLAKSLGVPVVVISGSLAAGCEELLGCGVVKLYALMEDGVGLDEAMRDGAALLEKRAERAILEFISGERNHQ